MERLLSSQPDNKWHRRLRNRIRAVRLHLSAAGCSGFCCTAALLGDSVQVSGVGSTKRPLGSDVAELHSPTRGIDHL